MIFRCLSKALLLGILVGLPVSETKERRCLVPQIHEKNGDEIKVVEVIAGKDVKLACQVKDKTVRTSWLKNNKTLHTLDHQRMRIKTNKYLKIKKTEKGDTGSYTCTAANDCGRNAYTIQLFVESPTKTYLSLEYLKPAAPRFTVSPEKLARSLLAFPVGNSVKMDCSADGYPRPTVRWFKDGKLFRQRKGGSRLYLSPWTLLLTMKDLVPTDAGTYTCNVSNAYGWINHTYHLDVHERVRAEPVVLPMQNVTVYEGENATLLCKAWSDSGPHFQWLRWLQSPSNRSTNSTIEQPHYEVIKQNDHYLNQHLLLPQSNNNFDFHGVKLIMVNVTKKDEGKYTCIVGNAVGYAVEQAYIIVYKQKDAQDVSQTHFNSSDDVPEKHGNISDGTPATKGRKGEKPGNKSSGGSKFQYPGVLIGMLIAAVVLLTVAFGLCYWQIKKARAQSSATNGRRPVIDSLRAKHEVQNEYVVVPDFN